jgi:hypothetical protein
LESTDRARLVRAHELMHARISPLPEVMERALREATIDALTSAEEFRVNTLVARVGFDMNHLQDGTEVEGLRECASRGDWQGTIMFLSAILGCGSEPAAVKAIAKARPEWAKGIRSFVKEMHKRANDTSTELMSATEIEDETPRGFLRFTQPVASLIDSAAGVAAPAGVEELRQFRRSLQPGGRRGPSKRFAELVWLETGLGVGSGLAARGKAGPRAVSHGTVMQYPNRLLTDPQRRAFSRRGHHEGGVVVIDQSGSMDLDIDDLAKLIKRFPDSLVLGYSHRPGDTVKTPNAWILANRGRLASVVPSGNVGNGVDGPILEFAQSQRCRGESMVWVCDGQVTDSNDHPCEELSDQVARFIRDNHVRMVKTLAEVPAALRLSVASPQRGQAEFGRVGRELEKMRVAPVTARAPWRALEGVSVLAGAEWVDPRPLGSGIGLQAEEVAG